jgi:hypothetical protein
MMAEKNGGRTRARTVDPMIKSHLLYQLSYASPWALQIRATPFEAARLVCFGHHVK